MSCRCRQLVGLINKTKTIQKAIRDSKKYEAVEKLYSAGLKAAEAIREKKETDRVSGLVLNGLMDHPSTEMKELEKHPLFRLVPLYLHEKKCILKMYKSLLCLIGRINRICAKLDKLSAKTSKAVKNKVAEQVKEDELIARYIHMRNLENEKISQEYANEDHDAGSSMDSGSEYSYDSEEDFFRFLLQNEDEFPLFTKNEEDDLPIGSLSSGFHGNSKLFLIF